MPYKLVQSEGIITEETIFNSKYFGSLSYGTFIAFLLCHDFPPRYQSCFEVVLGYCEKRESTSTLVDITAKDDLRIIILNMSWRQDFGHNMETLLQAEQKKLQNMFRPWLEARVEEKIILGYVIHVFGKMVPKNCQNVA